MDQPPPHPDSPLAQSSTTAVASRFSPYVQEHIGWYVYLLRDPRDGAVFYVGKGKGDRVFQHARDALQLEHDSQASLKLRRIRDIVQSGAAVQTEILRHGISSEKAAYEVEAAVIDTLRAIGRPLDNIVLGHRHALNGWASTETVASIYEAEPLPPTHEPIVFFKIPNLWTPAMSPAELFEATRGWWKVGERVRGARYALAVHKGVTRAAYRIDYWRERVPTDRVPHERGHSESDNHKRLGFWGSEAPEVAHLVNRSIKHLSQPAGSPVVYLNLPESSSRQLPPVYRGTAALEKAASETNGSASRTDDDLTLPRHPIDATERVLLQPLTYSDGFTLGAIVADRHGAKFLWAPGVEPWFDSDERMAQVGGDPANWSERSPESWLQLACFGISFEYWIDAQVSEHTSRGAATQAAQNRFALNQPEDDVRDAAREDELVANEASPASRHARQAQAMEDFVDAGGDIDDPREMLTLVASMLGPIDPQGPNGWILKAMDGEPYDKADAWIRWDH